MKKIVWISSYPKSGNTFLRAMLSAFFYSKEGIFKQDYLKNISEFPRDFFDFKSSNNFLNEIKEYEKIQKKISSTDKEVIFLKTHLANLVINETFQTINKDFTLCSIYIVRDPRNVILSLKNHYNLDIKKSLSLLTNDKNFISMNNKNSSKGYTLTLDWASNYLSWKNQKNINTIFVKFEDLVFEQEKAFSYILNKLKKFVNFEIDQKKTCFTFNTLQQVRKQFPSDELMVILGTDQFEKLNSWKYCRELARICQFLVFSRHSHQVTPPTIPHLSYQHMNNELIDCSSTEIRNRIKNNQSIEEMIPDIAYPTFKDFLSN